MKPIKKILVIGGINVDILASARPLNLHDSSPGSVHLSFGGVARNMAENIARLGLPVSIAGVIGQDIFGASVKQHLESLSIDTRLVTVLPKYSTGTYLAVSDEKDMVVGINDMVITDQLSLDWARHHFNDFNEFDIFLFDTNLPEDTLVFLTKSFAHKTILIDPVSTVKAKRLTNAYPYIHTIKPNKSELLAMANTDDVKTAIDRLLDYGVHRIIMTQGQQEVLVASKEKQTFYPVPSTPVTNVTGAGDSFVAGIAAGLALGYTEEQQLQLAIQMSRITIQDEQTVSPSITPSLLKERKK